jgi:hypothetical protein
MGYLDSFADPLFKTDADGRTVFFPSGKLGRGRIVPDAATALRLRNAVKYGMPVMILLAVVAVTGLSLPIGLAVAVAIGILFQVYMQFQVRGLAYSDARLTFGEVRQRQADALGFGWLVALAVGSAVLALSSLAMAILSPEQVWMGVFGTVFFGVCLAMILNMIRIRSRA